MKILFRTAFILFMIIFGITGCKDKNKPTLEEGVSMSDFSIGESDCPQGDVLLSVSSLARPEKGTDTEEYNVEVDVSVTCSGKGISGAQVFVEFWWREKAEGKTDEKGNVKITRSTTYEGRGGTWVNVTLVDNAGNIVSTRTSMAQAKFE